MCSADEGRNLNIDVSESLYNSAAAAVNIELATALRIDKQAIVLIY